MKVLGPLNIRSRTISSDQAKIEPGQRVRAGAPANQRPFSRDVYAAIREADALLQPSYMANQAEKKLASMDEAIEEIEREVDCSFASNALKNEEYAQAVWTLLSVTEDYFLKVFHHPEDVMDIFTDVHMNALTYPLRVCQKECTQGERRLKKAYIEAHYKLAWDWLELATHGYTDFHTLFPLWHRGRIELAVEGKRLRVTTPLQDKRYEAYNRVHLKDAKPKSTLKAPLPDFEELVASKTSVRNGWFRVNFDPELVKQLVSALKPTVIRQHSLPDGWAFGGFTLSQFREVMITVQAMMTGWFTARCGLAAAGMPGMGFTSAVWVVPKDELAARLRRYTGIELTTLKEILELLTFGSSGIRNPDIATQPLVDLRNGDYALSPFVWMGTNPERNLCALLNQIPEHRRVYSRLVNEKEILLREEVEEFLKPLCLEVRSGELRGTDLDLGIVDRKNRCCLCLELKWFIEPAEIREIEERTQELMNGVAQAKKIQGLFERKDDRLIGGILNIESDFHVRSAVASQNWIGHAEAQDDEIPIIKVWHLLHHIRDCGSLRTAMDWLFERKYLPVAGTDFEAVPMHASCGEWSCEWYGIKPLG